MSRQAAIDDACELPEQKHSTEMLLPLWQFASIIHGSFSASISLDRRLLPFLYHQHLFPSKCEVGYLKVGVLIALVTVEGRSCGFIEHHPCT